MPNGGPSARGHGLLGQERLCSGGAVDFADRVRNGYRVEPRAEFVELETGKGVDALERHS
jgi:hypothetical protein